MISTNPKLAAVVRDRLISALGPHALSDEARIVVHADGDRVTLHGCVPSWIQHEALERAARSTPGVTDVDNQLALTVKARLHHV